ncbi:ribokinase [Ruania albidiflava]|uniref:ribokinase n=1 Tax=Ruania albidiflava TaxID=366586 RepID=UPI0003B3F489|nr:ribokinase [Ruania albidiflava]
MTVVVVGSVNTDVVARVARIPGPGETLLGEDLARYGGGKGANQAVAAARAGGARVAFVGAVGSDPDADVRRRDLETEGIDTTGLVSVPGPTGTALITVAADGENAIVVAAGANAAREELEPAQRDVLARAGAVITQLEVPVPLVLQAGRERPEGSLFLLNAAPSAAMTEPATAADLLAVTDVLVVNEHELADIAGAIGTEAAIVQVAEQVPVLIVTLGSAGALVVVGTERRQVPAFEVTAVDTTGAGDTFCGVLAARLAATRPAEGSVPAIETVADAARVASAAAALAVGTAGAQDSVPTAGAVADLLARAAPRDTESTS